MHSCHQPPFALVRPWASATVGLILTATMGCSSNRIEQCNQLIEPLNQTETSLSTITQTSPPDVDALQQIAEVASQASGTLTTVEVSDTTLQSFRDQFQTFYNTISRDATAIVEAHDQQNLQAANTAYENLQTTFGQQEALVGQINEYCSAESSP